MASDPGGICDHSLKFQAYDRFWVGQVNRVAVALAHLPAICAEYFRKFGELLHRFRKYRLVEAIEPAGQFPREFKVRQLVLPYRHEIRLLDEDIRSLEHRIAEKTVGA